VIDTYSYNQFNADSAVKLNAFNNADEVYDRIDDVDMTTGRKKRRARLTEDQHLLCSPILKGYALKSKKWRMTLSLSPPKLLFCATI
jgi:hypothetical protein